MGNKFEAAPCQGGVNPTQAGCKGHWFPRRKAASIPLPHSCNRRRGAGHGTAIASVLHEGAD